MTSACRMFVHRAFMAMLSVRQVLQFFCPFAKCTDTHLNTHRQTHAHPRTHPRTYNPHTHRAKENCSCYCHACPLVTGQGLQVSLVLHSHQLIPLWFCGKNIGLGLRLD